MNLPDRPRSRNFTMPATLAKRVSSLPRPTFSPALKRVPRCRTRMDPPVTNSPPNAFTPSRCAFESRPFLELPSPFLCAILHLCQNLVHGHFGEILPVTDRALVLLLALELEDDHFVAATVRFDGALHARISRARAGHQFVRIVHQGQHTAEFHFRANFTGQGVHLDNVSGSHFQLFATGFNYCVHNYPSLTSEMCGLLRQARARISPAGT